jgi:hypothetical protein
VLSVVTTSSACLRRQVVYFGMWLYVVYVCACLMYLSVGCLVVHNQTSHRQVHHSRTHIDNIQPHTKINNLTTQTSRGGSNNTKHERRPPEDSQTIVIETCRVLMKCFTNIFNNLEF